MVSIRGLISLAVVAAVGVAIIYFRDPLLQTAQNIGSGLSSLGKGISDVGGGLGAGIGSTFGGIGAGVSSFLSPFGLAQGFQQAQYSPYTLPQQGAGQVSVIPSNMPNHSNSEQANAPANFGQSHADQVVTPSTRDYSDSSYLIATAKNANTAFVNLFQGIQAMNPQLGHAQAVQQVIAQTNAQTPYQNFTQTVAALKAQGYGAGDAFSMAKQTLTGTHY